jgi:hypothetical protein
MSVRGSGTTKTQAHDLHAQHRAHEIEVARAVARMMVEDEGHKYVWFQLVAKRAASMLLFDDELNQRWGGSVFQHDDDYWVRIGTIWVGNRARGVNESMRGVWAPAATTPFMPEPAQDILRQGRLDLAKGWTYTDDAQIVLRWLDTVDEMISLNRKTHT